MSAGLASARAAAERLAPPAGGTILLYGAYTAALFVVFLIATFPHDLLVERLLARALPDGLAADLSGTRVGWGLAASIADLRVLPRDGQGPPVLALEGLRVAPSLLGIVRGTPYPVGARARLYGGTLEGTLDARPAALDVDARVADLDLGRYPLADGRLRGRVQGTVVLRGDTDRPATLNGHVTLAVQALAAEGVRVRGILLPDLHFTQVQVAGTVTNGRLEITELRGAGDEISVEGGGTILLRDPLAASLANLQLTVQPAPAAPQAIRLALNLLPGAPDAGGARTVQVAGSLGQPRLR